ncbi:BPTI/Kunitz domain-containing protein-like [Mya arenaria]|uniref:BPTI/Kunitz domain-containing protein-like n=1 Tax=Mya arenaria TaxID=6604 RepID=UPI0022E17341|nr:BPTI/Kunitz domain-containing protein-like [Mya arenaria]
MSGIQYAGPKISDKTDAIPKLIGILDASPRISDNSEASPKISVCTEPKKVGPCKGAIPRYYYNSSTETCKDFLWGGCKSNGNNFGTLMDCEDTCITCRLPKKKGRCRGRFPRWYFNAARNQCRRFFYGGCGRNANNFRTKYACMRVCVA